MTEQEDFSETIFKEAHVYHVPLLAATLTVQQQFKILPNWVFVNQVVNFLQF